MANKGSITYETDMGTFLDYEGGSGGKTSDITDGFGKGGLESIDSGFTQLLTAEMDKGLSEKALSINGRAPLNDIAREIKKRIIVTLDDIADLIVLAEREGNQHRQIEAREYWTKVKEHYQELWGKCQDAVDAYNNNRKYKSGKKEDGSPEYSWYDKCSLNDPGNYQNEIHLDSKPDGDSSYAGEVNSTFETAHSFYTDKVIEAKKHYDFCNGLPTAVSGVVGTHVSNEDAQKIEGVQPGAKKDVTTDLGGKLVTETYTNPDGSTVELQKENGKIVSHKVKNSEGWLDEEVKYNEKGEPTKKITYTRKQIEEGKSLFEVTPTEYEYKNGSFSTEGKEVSDGSFYQYRTPNGQIATTNPGDEQPNMNHVADKKVNTNADKELESGSTKSEDDSGQKTGDMTGTGYVAGKYASDGTQYSEVDGYVRQQMENKEDFVLPKGYKFFGDKPWDSDNTTVVADEKDRQFKYVESEDCYYLLNEDGTFSSDNKKFSRKDFLKSKGTDSYTEKNQSGIVSADDTKLK